MPLSLNEVLQFPLMMARAQVIFGGVEADRAMVPSVTDFRRDTINMGAIHQCWGRSSFHATLLTLFLKKILDFLSIEMYLRTFYKPGGVAGLWWTHPLLWLVVKGV